MTPIVHFRTSQQNKPKVDLDSRVISGVIMAKVGEAKGHGVHIELTELQKAAKQANKMAKVPAEFGHNWEGLGKGLGNFLNVRIEGDCMLGDLHFLESADSSPVHPGMATYIMELAREDKTRVNSSIKFERGIYYQRDKNGTQIRVYYYDDENGWISPLKEYGKVYQEIKQLIGCDLVSSGALTEKLYSDTDLYTQFQAILNNPEFRPVLEAHYNEMPLLAEFFDKKSSQGIIQKLKSLFTNHTEQMSKETPKPTANPEATPDATVDTVVQAELAALRDQVTALQSTLDSQTPEAQLAAANAKIAELEAKNAPSVEQQLAEAQAKIEELSKAPAAETTSTTTTEDPPAKKESWLSASDDQARAIYQASK